MTQVVTVSANTAAYAVEGLRPSARVSGQAPSDKTPKAQASEARRTTAQEEHAPLDAVRAPSVARFFLTAQKQPNATYERAHEEYLAALEEYRAEQQNDAQASGEDDTGGA